MLDKVGTTGQMPETRAAQDWVKVLAAYREPNTSRSLFELAITLGPFVALWGAAWWSLSISPWLTLALTIPIAGFLLRLFIIQHDCGHGSFLANKTAALWLGRAIGVLTLTPYDVWQRAHAIHHGASGNLNRRGLGDIKTLTVEEYKARTIWGKLAYRLYRHPLVLFVIGPAYNFFLEYRLPLGLHHQAKYWISAMATNVAILAALGLIYAFGGWQPILLIFVPSTALAAMAGVWLFYVQHQFETTHWAEEQNWQLHDAALHGSSYYVLPPALQWITGNIGIHHVHHLYSRIPFYRLPEVLRDHGELADINRLTIRESIATARLHLWDANSARLLSFRDARAIEG
jgi:omega-6 fatty acid desaturase (delta-12 desaturase)